MHLQYPFIFPALETPRLWLRQLLITDAGRVAALRSDEQVNKYLGRPAHTSIEEARGFIEMINKGLEEKGWFYWAIAVKPAAALVGTICLWNLEPEKMEVEIGFELVPAYQGKGIMQETIECILRYGFETLKLEKINSFTEKENIASVKVLERNHFKEDETLKAAESESLIGYSLNSTTYYAARG